MNLARPALLALVQASLLLTACTGDDEPDPAPTTAAAAAVESPPALEERWESEPVPGADGLTLRSGPADADVLVLSDDRDRVVGLDAATGELRWQWQPPAGRICATSDDVSAAGVLGLLLDSGPRRGDCVEVAALDVASGELRWKRTVPGRPPYWSGTSVQVGERTVLAEMFCDEVVRFAAASGRPLETLAPRDRACSMDAAVGHGVVGVIDDPATADTPDDRGTGWIPPHDRVVAREVYDADTARPRWRVEMDDDGTDVVSVVSADPLVLVWDRLGQRVAQVFDDRGRLGPAVSPRLSTTNGDVTVVGQSDGVLVLQALVSGAASATAPFAGTTYAYDLATGEERWRSYDEVVPVGVVDGRVVQARVVALPRTEDSAGGTEVWLTDRDVADGAVRTLGAVPVPSGDGYPLVGLAGTDLLVSRDGRIVAVPVPADGEERVYDVPVPAHAWDADDLAEGELLPADVAGACEAVGDDTLTALGFRSVDLPAPSDCRWSEAYQPEHVRRTLSVGVQALPAQPTSEDEDPTATESALAFAEQLVARNAEGSTSARSSTGWSAAASVEGVLGDRVWSATSNAPGGGLESSAVVVWRNIVLTARASQDVVIGDRRPQGVPAAALAQGVHDALADVLVELGAEAPAGTPDPGLAPYAAAPDACAALPPSARDLLGAGRDESPRSQEPAPESWCSWRDGDVEASVRLLAAHPLDGDPAAATAAELFDLFESGRAVPGLGEQARLRADLRGEYPSAYLLVLEGNAIVQVSLFDVEGLGRDEMVDLATTMARRLLRGLTSS